MNSIKCPNCGLVNWSNAETCKRCQAVLPAAASSSSYEPPQPPTPTPLGWQQSEPPPQQQNAWQQTGQQQNAWQPPNSYNPYPSYADYQPANGGTMVLASRGSRFFASLLDSLCIMVPVMLGVFLFAFVGNAVAMRDEMIPTIIMVVAGFIVLSILGVQLYLLSKDGQTIGKKCLGIRIVKAGTGENGGFVSNALMRSILPSLIGNIPAVGPIFSLADVLFIFREDQRCLHDLIAGTCVVKA
jgi:uncharacterized RDD family membrane protein YckC